MAGIDEDGDALLTRYLGGSLQAATLRLVILVIVLAAILAILARLF
jgi:hypothetical protein